MLRTVPTSLIVAIALAAMSAASATGAHAQVRAEDRPSDNETPRGMAMGSGVRASAAGTSAVDYNPANLPVARLYHIEGFYGYDPTFGIMSAGGALADSTTDYMHAGASMRAIIDTSGRGYSGFDGRVALAFPLGTMFGVGVAGRYASISRSGMVPAGMPSNYNVIFERFTMDAALRVTPIPGLHIAAIGTNLLDTGTALAPRLVGGSASYTIDNAFTFGADLFFDLTAPAAGHVIDAGYHWMVGGGAEYLIGGRLPVRAGYYYDKARDVHVVSFGVGYVDQKFAVDLAWRQEVESAHRDDLGNHDHGPLQTTLLVDFRYFIQ